MLREYGRHVLGIGPSEITHPLLVKACDEFVYMETILGPEPEAAVPMPTSLAASYESIFAKVIAADLEREPGRAAGHRRRTASVN